MSFGTAHIDFSRRGDYDGGIEVWKGETVPMKHLKLRRLLCFAAALALAIPALSLRAAERVSPMVQLPGVREVVRFDGDAYLV